MQPTNPSTARGLTVDKLSQEGERQGLRLASSADPDEFIEVLLHVSVPCFTDERKRALYAHDCKVLLDLTGSLDEREPERDVKRVREHGCGFAEDEQPYLGR